MTAPRPDRRELVARILRDRGDALVVTGLGTPTWDVAAAGDHDANLYLWGAMGQAVPTALGLALAQPGRRVLCVTGDGEMLMGLGALAVVASQPQASLGVLVLDDERFSETGDQAGLTELGTDLEAIARGAGIPRTMTLAAMDGARDATAMLLGADGPAFVLAKVAQSGARPVHPERHGAAISDRVRRHLGL
jgi:thiamine pyrophosphate-dependent acetolactate synthase large subunit-like protein